MENILEYEKLVYSIIHRYTKSFDKDDLYQVGMLGLLHASKNFDPTRENIKFSTYAYYYILGEVKKYIRENRSIKVSKEIIQLNQKIEKTKSLMQQKLGREPTLTEISLFLEIDEEKLRDALMANEEIKSLDYETEEEQDLYNFIKVQDQGMNADILDLREQIHNLSEEEQRLIFARYYEDLTQTEASQELGISQVQVSRKENKIFQKLKQNL